VGVKRRTEDDGLSVGSARVGRECSVSEVFDPIASVGLPLNHEVFGFAVESSGRASGECASASSAVRNASGKTLPRLTARRKIPAAAFRLKKNRGATSAITTSAKDEDSPSPLGHSEVTAIQHSPGDIRKPEFVQRREKDGEISATVR